ncbi:MAG: OmpA family protein [Gemmatimonadetes bacterium]|nr:OmpA family protein [Gemmatimonadota bacterium]
MNFPRRGPRAAFFALLPTLALGCCVKQSTHNTVLDQLAESNRELERVRGELEDAQAARVAMEADLQRDLSSVQSELADTRAQLERVQQEALAEATERTRLGQLASERSAEAETLRRRLEALEAVEREIRERNAIYENVIGRFRSLIEAGQLSVSIDRGRMVINLPQDILFPSGSATLNSDGRGTLTEVGSVLTTIEDRRFQVEGHTDNVPISTARFPSNWELSAARALSVVNLLQDSGVPPERLSGAGYGEYQPVASNDDADGRRLNRRIEIVMLPNLDVISNALSD